MFLLIISIKHEYDIAFIEIDFAIVNSYHISKRVLSIGLQLFRLEGSLTVAVLTAMPRSPVLLYCIE